MAGSPSPRIHVPSEGRCPTTCLPPSRSSSSSASRHRDAVYEDQGAPFELRGDCVLQPPTCATASSPAAAGSKSSSSAVRPSRAAPTGLALPNAATCARRGQPAPCASRSARGGRARRAPTPTGSCGATGVRDATGELADVRVARPAREGSAAPASLSSHDADFAFRFVLRGKVTLRVTDERRPWWRRGRGSARSIALAQGDSVAIPAGRCFGLVAPSDDLELLEVTLRLGLGEADAAASEGGDARPP